MSVESCSSSMACDMEEVCSESSRKMKDMEETTSETSWTAVTKGKDEVVWTLELEGETERPGAIVPLNGAEGVSVNPEGESRHRLARAKMGKEGKRESNKNGREGKWKCTPGRVSGASESEKESDSGGF